MSYFECELRFIPQGDLHRHALRIRCETCRSEETMKSHRIAGGGGTELNVTECGNPKGRAILFLHGASQCSLQWSRQIDSALARNYRLVAMDLRGHGDS